jgi:hypothetical protein
MWFLEFVIMVLLVGEVEINYGSSVNHGKSDKFLADVIKKTKRIVM